MRRVKIGWLYVVGITFFINSITGYQPRIVIVGAGTSGIAAASKLYERGFRNVTIIEAEGRVGGRVYTKRFDDKWIDLGGQYGQVGNIVYELAWPRGLLELPKDTGTKFAIYNSNGYQISSAISDNLTKIFFEAIRTDRGERNGTVKEYLTEILNTEFGKFSTINDSLKNSFIQLFEGFAIGADNSNSRNNTRAKDYVEFWERPGNGMVNWKDKGYGILFELLTKKYPNPEEELPILNNTLLNTEIVNINYNTKNGKVLLETTNGKKYEADHVIVTVSLGVLKAQHETFFTPRLSQSKVKAINGLEFGTLGKIILSFDKEWWPSSWNSVGFVWDENVRQEYENDPEKKWLLDILAFTKLPYKPKVLVGWVNGPGSQYMETLSEDQLFNQTISLLDRFLGKSFNIPRPTKILQTNWYSNRHFRGAYSYRSSESQRADVWTKDLAAPLLFNDSPIVLFAGEATINDRVASVDGGLKAGNREANRLIDIYKDILD